MKQIASNIAFGILILLFACAKEPDEIPKTATPVAVNLSLRTDAQRPVSRATDENAVRDVNIYFINKHTETSYHTYAAGATIHTTLPPGDYTVYAVANAGRDMGERSRESLPSLAFPVTESPEALPMSATKELSVTRPGTLPSITVGRNMAKINFSVCLDRSLSGLTLLSYRLMNLPVAVVPFRETGSLSSSRPEDYTDRETVPIEANACSTVLYLPENLQGVNDAITDQRQKNRENAPACATYINIRASAGSAVYDYYVYLGGNNTTDFNVKGNGIYNLAVTVKGTQEVDARMDSYTVSLSERPSAHSGYFTQGESIEGKVTVECSGVSRRFRVRIRPDRPEHFYLNGNQETEYGFELPAQGVFDYTIDYKPAVFDAAASGLCYTVTVLDEEDFPISFRREHRFANVLTVYTPLSPGGEVRIDGALQSSRRNTDQYICQEILCSETGCKLTPQPVKGSRFLGWYDTPESAGPVSTDAVYTFVPIFARQELYARFSVPAVRLDEKGTANCYIAGKKNTLYAFRCDVKGNGRQTEGLPAPAANRIVSTAVLWESGPRGSVVRSAEVSGNDIEFTSGDTYGNALIGGFNANGDIEWSWHIWFTDYDPDATAQTYGYGDVFMDRNLGALSATPGEKSSGGLFYQWGRKDPFPAGQTDMSYAPGYEYRTVRGTGNTGLPLDYAIANPTHYIVGADNPRPMYDYEYMDWLDEPDYRLWGNLSPSISEYVVDSKKSIYDPCPPGWKIPDPSMWYISPGSTVAAPGGVFIFYDTEGNKAYYPLTHSLYGPSGVPNERGTSYWTSAPGTSANGNISSGESRTLVITGGKVIFVRTGGYSFRSRGCQVRCVQE